MRNSGQINAEMMAVTNKIGDLTERQVDIDKIEDAAERDTAMQAFQNEFKDLNDQRKILQTKYEAALITEEAELARDVPVDAKSKEAQEFIALREKFDMNHAAKCAGGEKPMQGAEAEFAAACLGTVHGPQGGAAIPMEWFDDGPLLEDVEKFATTLADGAREIVQQPVLERIYSPSALSFLRVDPIAASPGVQNWPTFATSGAATARDRDQAVDESNTSITVRQVTPTALSMRYRLNVEDSLVLGNNEPLHRMDMINAMVDAYDGFRLGDAGFGSITDVVSAVVTTWGEIANLGSLSMDGLYAQSEMDIRALMSVESYRYGAGNFYSDVVPLGAIQYLRSQGTEVRSTNRIVHEGDKASQNLIARTREQGAVTPMWGGIELIRDIYTGADRRRVWLTAVSYVGFLIRRPDVYSKFIVRTAA